MLHRRLLGMVVLCAVFGGQYRPLNADTVPVFGTGVAADGTPLAAGAIDPHYQLISYPGQVGGVAAPVYAFDALPLGYLPNGPSSKWISPSLPFGDSPAGMYIYRTTFDLTGFDPLAVVLRGWIASDNEAVVFLNGIQTPVTTPNIGYETAVAFALSDGLLPGLNTLDIRVKNDSFTSFNPTALRLDLDGFVVTTPEPSTLALAGGLLPALIALAVRNRRRLWAAGER